MNSKNPSPGHKITAEISIHLDQGGKVVTLFISSDELPGTVITRARDPKAVAQLVDWYHAQDANTQGGTS